MGSNINNNHCKIVSFNCKSVKRSTDCIRNILCPTADIIGLQETWLLPHDLPYLGSIHNDFEYTGKSAVDTSAGTLRGRPYGGVAIMYRKGIFSSVTVITCDSARISAVKFTVCDRSFIVVCVYMPNDIIDNLLEFTECMGEIGSIVHNNDVEAVFVIGDYNAHPSRLFGGELLNFCDEQDLVCADVKMLGVNSGSYTFISEVSGSTSWLDHCIVTQAAWRTITDITIRKDVFWSDHLPVEIICNLNIVTPKVTMPSQHCNKINWGIRNPLQIQEYQGLCNSKFSKMHLPEAFKDCCDKSCKKLSHRAHLDKWYLNIVNVLRDAAVKTHQIYKSNNRKCQVVGWNEHVSDAHREARIKFQNWIFYGKPLEGIIYTEMRESRKFFKNKLKWCKNNEEQIKMNIIASHHAANNFCKFWKETNKLHLKPSLPVSVSGISDQKGIAELFKQQFRVESLLGATPRVIDCGLDRGPDLTRFSAKDVASVIKGMKRGKSPGHDCLSVEHLRCAGVHLPRVLSMFYSLCMSHSYLPPDLMSTLVVPIVKNRTGDISDKENYRPISLAAVAAKVLDGLLNIHLEKYLKLHDAQFGFRAGLSTESAIMSLKHTVRYYTARNTPVYACFLDLSKAFDRVCYDRLWHKLKDAGLPADLLSIFEYWYSNQDNRVKWSGELSEKYRMDCGLRQGGLTSPALFNLYVDELIGGLSSMHVGCHVDGVCLNNLSYADDMVLLGPSVGAIRVLLSACETYAADHGLLYNVNKSKFVVFKVGNRSPMEVPSITLNGVALDRVTQFKYLGHIVTENLRDDVDIERERRALAVRSNMLARRFARCSKPVKITLFRAYCQSFYTSSLWSVYAARSLSALRVQYNNAFRVLLRLPPFCSASEMFAEARIDGFPAIRRKRAASLLNRVRCSTNSIMNMISGRWDCPVVNGCMQVLVG